MGEHVGPNSVSPILHFTFTFSLSQACLEELLFAIIAKTAKIVFTIVLNFATICVITSIYLTMDPPREKC